MGNYAQLGGGSDAERSMSTLAYGWVERCSGIAGCGKLHSKISIPCNYPCNCIVYMNYDEHAPYVECMFSSAIMLINDVRQCIIAYFPSM